LRETVPYFGHNQHPSQPQPDPPDDVTVADHRNPDPAARPALNTMDFHSVSFAEKHPVSPEHPPRKRAELFKARDDDENKRIKHMYTPDGRESLTVIIMPETELQIQLNPLAPSAWKMQILRSAFPNANRHHGPWHSKVKRTRQPTICGGVFSCGNPKHTHPGAAPTLSAEQKMDEFGKFSMHAKVYKKQLYDDKRKKEVEELERQCSEFSAGFDARERERSERRRVQREAEVDEREADIAAIALDRGIGNSSARVIYWNWMTEFWTPNPLPDPRPTKKAAKGGKRKRKRNK